MLSHAISALVIAWLTCFGIAYALLGMPIEMVLVSAVFFSAIILLAYLGGLFVSWMNMKTQDADYRSFKEVRFRWTTLRMEEGRPAQVTNWQGDATHTWFEWTDITIKKQQQQKWIKKDEKHNTATT